MRQHHLFVLFGLVVCLAQPRDAAAQARPAEASAPSEDAKKEASSHFRRAVELYQEGAFRAALVEFQRAYDIAPDYRLFYNIGQAQLQVQDYLGASQSYERYLAEGGAQVSPDRRNEVETALGALRERVARLSIKVNLSGAEVFVDDLRVGTAPLPSTVSVNVGRHRVYARAADGTEGEKMVDVAGGDLSEIAIELVPKVTEVVTATEAPRPEASKPREKLSRKKRAAIATWSVALATGAAAIATGVTASNKTNELDKQLDIKPPEGEASPHKVNDLRNSANGLAITTDVLLGTAVASAVTGVVLWIVDGKQKRADVESTASTASLTWGAGLGSLSLKGKF